MSPLKEINAIFIESNKLINFLYSSMYTPPFTISSRAIHLIADISALVKRYATGRCFAIAENQPN